MAGDGHAADLEGGGDDAVAEGQVVADQLDVEQDLLEVAGQGDFLYRLGQLTLSDPKADRAPRIVACDEADTRADQLGHVEAGVHRPDDPGRIVKLRMIRGRSQAGLSLER